MRSADLPPGTRVKHRASGSIAVLARRKNRDEHSLLLSVPFWPGWWLRDNRGGLADHVIDGGDWEVLEADADA